MTKLIINFRLGMKYKEFEIDFFFSFVESKGKAILGAGMTHNFCRGSFGARKAIVLMLLKRMNSQI